MTPPSHLNLDVAGNDTAAADGEFRLVTGCGTPGGDSALAEEEITAVAQGMRDADEITIGMSAEGT